LEIVRTSVELRKPVTATEAGLTLGTGQIGEHEFNLTAGGSAALLNFGFI
jgi:hypothetical protein